MDYYYSLVNEERLEENQLVVVNVFKPKDWSLGINLQSRDLAECMRNRYYHDYATILYNAIVNENVSEPVSFGFRHRFMACLRTLVPEDFGLWHA